MKAIGSVIRAPLKALGIVSSPGKAPAPLRTPTRDDVRVNQAAIDEILKRRGGAVDRLYGAGGLEADSSAGGKLTLGT